MNRWDHESPPPVHGRGKKEDEKTARTSPGKRRGRMNSWPSRCCVAWGAPLRRFKTAKNGSAWRCFVLDSRQPFMNRGSPAWLPDAVVRGPRTLHARTRPARRGRFRGDVAAGKSKVHCIIGETAGRGRAFGVARISVAPPGRNKNEGGRSLLSHPLSTALARRAAGLPRRSRPPSGHPGTGTARAVAGGTPAVPGRLQSAAPAGLKRRYCGREPRITGKPGEAARGIIRVASPSALWTGMIGLNIPPHRHVLI
jgi:hypothetical protein